METGGQDGYLGVFRHMGHYAYLKYLRIIGR